ncbi:MAG: AAA family ATPase [Atopobiaceae bacterium]|nr:AAA family ATPase [Atopobiaceae bacterium]MBR3315560.1 AAA family ATPase [Atopobiaceae bacterium]
MIESIEIEGFRFLRDFKWEPKEGVNVIVGANSTGKSTLLDAIELVTKGSIRNVRATSGISPDWFNVDLVNEFYESLEAGRDCTPPEISIVATFSGDRALAHLQGCHGPNRDREDKPGLWFRICVPEDLRSQFFTEVREALKLNPHETLPIEYYKCSWTTFKGEQVVRRPSHVSCSRVDASPEPHSRAVDSFTRSLIDSKLTDEQLRTIAGRIRSAHSRIDADILSTVDISGETLPETFGLQLDKSPRSDWRNAVVLEKGSLPLSVLGSAEQVMAKASVSLLGNDESPILLLEEPECHLSHTSLTKLLSMIHGSISPKQQVFVTTHSPFVLNRLGLDRTFLMAAASTPSTIVGLSPETVTYFKRLSGYDTLRIVLAEKAVLVEGPTDEMVFSWAFRKLRGSLPSERGIDVIEYGIRYKRAFELAASVDRARIAALRDNDGKSEESWKDAVIAFAKEGERVLFVGHDDEGRTLEPQMVSCNHGNIPLLSTIVGYCGDDEAGLEQHLLSHKTLWSLRLLETDLAESGKLNVPRYIEEAIDFIDPIEKSLS